MNNLGFSYKQIKLRTESVRVNKEYYPDSKILVDNAHDLVVFIEKRPKIPSRILEMAREGVSSARIAQSLNLEGGFWRISEVNKFVAIQAVEYFLYGFQGDDEMPAYEGRLFRAKISENKVNNIFPVGNLPNYQSWNANERSFLIRSYVEEGLTPLEIAELYQENPEFTTRETRSIISYFDWLRKAEDIKPQRLNWRGEIGLRALWLRYFKELESKDKKLKRGNLLDIVHQLNQEFFADEEVITRNNLNLFYNKELK